MLATNLILSNLDYCNAVLANAMVKQLKPLQKIQNDAVQFIFNLKLREHVAPYFVKLQFLPIKCCISLKLCLLAFILILQMKPRHNIYRSYFKTLNPLLMRTYELELVVIGDRHAC